jgi:hypothetical protein
MRTVFILALIIAVCMCSEEDVSEMETEEGGCNSIVLQKPSDNQGNMNNSVQNKKQGIQNFLCCDKIPIEDRKAKMWEIVQRLKEEREKPEFQHLLRQLKEGEQFIPEDNEFVRLILCGVFELEEEDTDLEFVCNEITALLHFINSSFPSPLVNRNPDLIGTVIFTTGLRSKLQREQRSCKALESKIQSADRSQEGCLEEFPSGPSCIHLPIALQNKKKGMLNILYCDDVPIDRKEAEVRKMVGRVDKERAKLEFRPLQIKLTWGERLELKENELLRLIFCRIFEMREDASIASVRRDVLKFIFFVKDGSFRSPYAKDLKLQKIIDLIGELRSALTE